MDSLLFTISMLARAHGGFLIGESAPAYILSNRIAPVDVVSLVSVTFPNSYSSHAFNSSLPVWLIEGHLHKLFGSNSTHYRESPPAAKLSHSG